MPNLLRLLTAVTATAAATACAAPSRAPSSSPPSTAMNAIAESYVKLALALGARDADYVDAYYGPPEWKSAADSGRATPAEIRQRVTALRGELASIDTTALDAMSRLRREYLDKQLRAMAGRVDFLEGTRLPFDEESRLMYDAVAPTNSEAHYRDVLARLDSALPGTGPVPARYQSFRERFVIPREKLDTVFRAAIAECRSRTAAHVALPPGESFTVEYVTNQPWSAYNWYKGGYRSVIQVNTDLPIFIDRAVDLACHEGYPGHHVYNALLEQKLVRERGWVEFSVYPLFSPQSLIAEGSANYGISVAFPGTERAAFEQATLFPLAGLDASRASEYYRVLELAKELGYAGNEAARRYLNGEIDADAAADWLTRYALYEPARARQRVRFMDKYRSYVINYNLGEDLVRHHVESRAGGNAQRRWELFAELLSSPRLPSGLR
jgi:hypothetical protein